MTPLTRRTFLHSSAALTLSAASYTRAAERTDKVRVAVMGLRIRGKQLLGTLHSIPNAEVTHVIDVDEAVVPPALAQVKDQAAPPKVETDVRKVLEDKSVDVLVVSAPDHWHALATIWALQAGKHVYCEKPVSHNIVEGRRMVQAARKYDRLVQVGTQRRSASHAVSAREFVQSGKLGKVMFARAWIAGNRPNIGKKADAPVPKGVDYNLWTGPAPERAFNPNRFHYNWHWFWETGTGEIGNNGIHGLDLARNVLGLEAPVRVTASGGKFFYDDDQQTPDTHIVNFDFASGPGGAAGCTLTWEHRVWEKLGPEGESFGVVIHGEKGTLIFDKDGWHVRGGVEGSDKAAAGIEKTHMVNFLDAVRGNGKLNADVEVGHHSTRLCHLGNIAFRVGRVLHFDGATETFKDDADANKLLGREYRKGFELPAV